jgi:hypothetical protein
MTAYFYITLPELARNDFYALTGIRLFGPQQLLRQKLGEAAVHLLNAFGCGGAAFETAIIDPFLDGDMRDGFELEIPFFRLGAVVVLEGALDLDRLRIIPFDKIAVLTINGSDEIGQCGKDAFRQAAAKSRRAACQLNRQIGKRCTVP